MEQHLLTYYRNAAIACICVEAGSDFTYVNKDHYQINPHIPEHYHLLLNDIEHRGHLPIKHIIHCWTYNTPSSADLDREILREQQYHGTYSILLLTQALARKHVEEQTVMLFVASRYSHLIDTAPQLHYNLSATTLGGLLPTISLELPWLRCSHIDLDDADDKQNAQRMLAEITWRSEEREIAYRKGKRLVSTLEPVTVQQQSIQLPPLQEHGVYLVTGGLGGIGSYLAAYLLQHYKARVILVGKTHLPERQVWPVLLEQDTPLALRLKHYRMLETLAGECYYEPVDVSDLASLQNVVRTAEERWRQPLTGILHLAGEGNLASHWQVVDQHQVINEQIETFETMFSPKVYGTWALYQLLKTHPQTWLLSFSSVNGLFGGSSFSAYSAANSFLDAYTHYQRLNNHPQTYTLSWSIWENIGMSWNNPTYATEAAFRMGYYMIGKEQGLLSCLTALTHAPQSWIVGLDRDNQHIQRYLRTVIHPLQRLSAYITTKTSLDLSTSLLLPIKDRYGTPSKCLLQQVSTLPLTDDGAVDYEQLQTQVQTKGQSRIVRQNSLPTTELEQTIASIWQEVLNIDHVAIDDNFFSLGGHSLRVSQVHNKLRAILPYDISVVDLFKYPTIHELTSYITQQNISVARHDESKVRAKLRKDLQKQRIMRYTK